MEAGIVATGADNILQPDICNGEELARAGAGIRPSAEPNSNRECSSCALQWELQAMAGFGIRQVQTLLV